MEQVFWTTGCILRDEGKYCIEWASWLYLIGCDRLICVLHQCKDDTEANLNLVKDQLGMDICVHHCKTEDKKVQMGTYRWIHEKYGQATEWMLFLDGDEYPYAANPTVNYQDDIKRMLRSFDKKISSVSFNAKVFGPNGHIVSPGNRLTAYTARLPQNNLSNHAIKTFFRPEDMIAVMSPHYQQVKGTSVRFDGKPFRLREGWGSQESPLWQPVAFNHYYTGSVEDWLSRYQRGSCNDLRSHSAYSLDEFLSHVQKTEHDDAIQKYSGWHNTLINSI